MTSTPHYEGLTWDHPRGFDALDAAARRHAGRDGLQIKWHRQPLEGFESHPISDLAARFDLVVLDHPCMGEVVAQECFLPLDQLFGEEECKTWSRTAVGPSYGSYLYAGKLWALPLDAATQVCAINPKLIDPAHCPQTWMEVLDLAERFPVCLSLGGPHALLSFFSLCAQIAGEENCSGQDEFFDDGVCRQAYEWLSALYAKSVRNHANKNPIGILDCMASTSEIALCPLIYGYVTYASSRPDGSPAPVAFVDVPRFDDRSSPRSTAGGTGLAISRRATITEALMKHVRYLMSPAYQVEFAPKHGGQPSSEAAWRSPEVNARVNGFYANTFVTMKNSWVRPRYAGYVDFQGRASALLRDALATRDSVRPVIGRLKAAYARSREPVTESREGINV